MIKVLLWLSPIYAPISAPFRISSPQDIIPFYPSLLTSGDYMGGYFSNSLSMLPFSYIGAFSSSDLRFISFCMMRPSYSGFGVSILIIFNPDPLDVGFKVLSFLDIYPLFTL